MDQPIVFQKIVVWLVLWEAIGLGCWLDAADLPVHPADRRDPLLAAAGDGPAAAVAGQGAADGGNTRTVARRPPLRGRARLGDLPAVRRRGRRRTEAGRLDPVAIAVLLGFLALLGLRDKVAFLAARPEVYGPLLIVFLFPLSNLIVGAQIVFLCIWLGAASSKLNRHFPFVVSVMISNTPWNRSRKAKALLYAQLPRGPAAGWRRGVAAHPGR